MTAPVLSIDTVAAAVEEGAARATIAAPTDTPAPTPPNVTARITINVRAVSPGRLNTAVVWRAGLVTNCRDD